MDLAGALVDVVSRASTRPPDRPRSSGHSAYWTASDEPRWRNGLRPTRASPRSPPPSSTTQMLTKPIAPRPGFPKRTVRTAASKSPSLPRSSPSPTRYLSTQVALAP